MSLFACSPNGVGCSRIDEKTEEIAGAEKEPKQLKEEQAKLVLKFEKEEVDLTGALVALDGAIHAMKASTTAVSLAQLKPVVQTVSRALVMAEALRVEPKLHKTAKQLVSLSEATVGDADTYSILGDDQLYLAALSKKKAVLWDERVQGRVDELHALRCQGQLNCDMCFRS